MFTVFFLLFFFSIFLKFYFVLQYTGTVTNSQIQQMVPVPTVGTGYYFKPWLWPIQIVINYYFY